MTQKQFKDICFTSYDLNIDWFKDWTNDNKTIVKYIIVQGEICPKTSKHHIQGFCQFTGQKRMEQIKKFFGDNTLHIEKRMGTVEQARDYCDSTKQPKDIWHEHIEYGEITLKKQGMRNDLIDIRDELLEGKTLKQLIRDTDNGLQLTSMLKYYRPLKEFQDTIRIEKVQQELIMDFDNCNWKQWQKDILDILENKPDNRKIHWIYDTKGNVGKSYLAKYLRLAKNAYYITGGKVNDILYGYDDEPIIIFDLPRTYADNMEHIYSVIEQFKNGMYLQTKYETKQRIFKIPHILVFTNFECDTNKLSKDRWNIINLDTYGHKPMQEYIIVDKPITNDSNVNIQKALDHIDSIILDEEIDYIKEQSKDSIKKILDIGLVHKKVYFGRYTYNALTSKLWDSHLIEWIPLA